MSLRTAWGLVLAWGAKQSSITWYNWPAPGGQGSLWPPTRGTGWPPPPPQPPVRGVGALVVDLPETGHKPVFKTSPWMLAVTSWPPNSPYSCWKSSRCTLGRPWLVFPGLVQACTRPWKML